MSRWAVEAAALEFAVLACGIVIGFMVGMVYFG